MGITYKLKQEVIGFILDQKQANPQMSCRKIADIASAHFQKKISKSSVNTILKQRSLSSPVGRRATKEKTPKTFKLPDFRKKQIFSNIPAKGFQGQTKAKTDQPKSLTAFEPQKPLEHAGARILRAVEECVSPEPILLRILKKYTPEHGQHPDAAALSRLCLYLAVLDVSFSESSREKIKSICDACGFSQPPQPDQVSSWIQLLDSLKEKRAEILLDCTETFTEADSFDFLLENNKEYSIDVQRKSVWTKNNVQSIKRKMILVCFDFLSKTFIFNKTLLVIEKMHKAHFSSCFYPFVYSCENIPGYQIKNIRLMNKQKEELFSWESIIAQRRVFIMGIDPAHREYADAFNAQDDQECELFWPLRNTTLCLVQKPVTIPVLSTEQTISLYMILFWDKENKSHKHAVLTNSCLSKISAQNVLKIYLDQWPYVLDSAQQQRSKECCLESTSLAPDPRPLSQALPQEASLPFSQELLNRLTGHITEYMRTHCFPQTTALNHTEAVRSLLQGLRGYGQGTSDLFSVQRSSVPAHAREEELFCLFRHLNESAVLSQAHQRLFFIITAER